MPPLNDAPTAHLEGFSARPSFFAFRRENMHKQANIHRLSDDLGATFDEHDSSVVLWGTRSYSAKRIEHLNIDEMNELTILYTDGCCPVCMNEIPQGDIVCDSCLDDALRNRNAKGMPTQYMHTLTCRG